MESELSVVQTIKENNYNIRIVINESKPYTLYNASDVGKCIGINNASDSIKYFNAEEKLKHICDTNGGKQIMLFLTYKGLLRILSASRQRKSIEFAQKIGIVIHYTKFTCVEVDTLQQIHRAFVNEEVAFQYSVDRYRIDLYFPKYKLAIECDEYHPKNQKNKDIERETRIKILIPGCHFIRYEPFETDFNIFDLINKIYVFIVENQGRSLEQS
jgi:very-short-patch-repair endonuclease